MRKPAKPTTERANGIADLDAYRRKRDFAKTAEPEGEAARGAALRGSFVVQRHDARRLHYDVRFEIDGAMMSFAVPKGPSYDPKIKRMAIEVEDHPIEYSAFEGAIPKGQYGGGDVVIWDRGTYETNPPGQARLMREKGHLRLRIFGDKLRGEWHVVRTGKKIGEGASWLFFKVEDEYANPALDIVEARPESVVAEPRGARAILAQVGDVARATHGDPRAIEASHYSFEIKYDGYRLLAIKVDDEVRLFSRAGHDWTDRFAIVAGAVAKIPVREVVIDGEACAIDHEGRPSFQALQQWIGGERREATLSFAAFDVLRCEGEDLRKRPIEARRAKLQSLLAGAAPPLTISAAIEGEPFALMEAVKKARLEGLIAKRKGSLYVNGQTPDWLKLKVERRQDFAVIGWVPLSGFKNVVGALILAVNDGGALSFAGKVGTGLDDAMRKRLAKILIPLKVDKPPVPDAERYKDAIWCKPALCVEVAFQEWTDSKKPRFPSFMGLREDKTPMECSVEAARVRPSHEDNESAARIDPPPSSAPLSQWQKPTLSNRDKILFPKDGIAKRDIWDYYAAIAPVILPHLAGRPINVQRWPHGIDGNHWFQHRPPEKAPSWVRIISWRDKEHVCVENVETLQWLANLAALTFHQYAGHAPAGLSDEETLRALSFADYVLLDLDPGESTWRDMVRVANAIRILLEALQLESVVKTSGKRGLHVLVPVAHGASHDDVHALAEQIARAVSKVLPEVATVERMKPKRGARLYVDYGQNGEGRTVVSPYTIRALDGAPVSAPLRWEEVDEALDPRAFTIRTILDRVGKYGDLLAPLLRPTNRIDRVLPRK